MFRSRLRSCERLGLSSIAMNTESPDTRKVTGTRCVAPEASAVPSTATGLSTKRVRACAAESFTARRYVTSVTVRPLEFGGGRVHPGLDAKAGEATMHTIVGWHSEVT